MVMVTISYGAFLVYLAFCPVYKEYMLIQSLNLIAAAVDISWLYMGLEDFKKTVLRNTMVKLASAAMIFMFVKDANDTWVYIFVLSISVLGGNLTLWPYVRKTLVKVDFRKLHPFRHFKPTIALFIPQIATQVYLVLNKTMLWAMVNSDVAGFYDRSDTLVKLVLTIVTATGTVMLPHVANAFMRAMKMKLTILPLTHLTSFHASQFRCLPDWQPSDKNWHLYSLARSSNQSAWLFVWRQSLSS